ncbi:MAG: cbb3-type cytochrome c oxidase subunit 3 [Gemmobacter sp.]|uniref:cbb3-type cytochrome c oxidase subunit 3 n=1 Tax=Gemmobacter sp. TaxID=1898957 RepID=UPI00391CE92E
METYDFLRHFADSWHLLFMTLFFLGVVVWALRPGSNKVHREAATSIFRNEDRPAPDRAGPPETKEA